MRRRTNSSGLTETEELRAWSMFFETGRDYFRDLTRLKLSCLPEEEGFEAVAKRAWKRLGPAMMQTWRATAARDLPWAVTHFGQP